MAEVRPVPVMLPARFPHAALACGYGLLLIAIGLVFAQTSGFEFLRWDDQSYVVAQPMVAQGLSWDGLVWAFDGAHEANWHPLTWLSHMADVSLFGLDAGAMHAVNALLHALNASLLFVLLAVMTRAPWKSLAVAALFALHPLHVESVAWISQRKELLAASFGLLTLLAYWHHARGPSAPRFALVVLCFVLSLLSKGTWITLPLLFLLLDFWPLRRLSERASWSWILAEKVLLLAIAAGFALITIWAQRQAIDNVGGYSTWTTLGNVPIAYMTYVVQMFVPLNLSYLYPLEQGVDLVRLVLSLAAITFFSLVAVRLRAQAPWWLVGWGWYLVSLLPVIGLIKVGTQAHADRYTYLPLIGLFVLILWSLDQWLKSPRAAASIVLAALLPLTLLSHVQASTWRNDIALYSQAVAVDPTNVRALRQLAALLEIRGDDDEAVVLVRALLEIRPDDYTGHYLLSLVALKRGDHSAAIEHAQRSLRAYSDWWYADEVIARAAIASGRTELARSALQHLLRYQPKDSAHYRDMRALLDSLPAQPGPGQDAAPAPSGSGQEASP